MDRTRSIHLSPRQNSFGFGFAVLNSTLPQLDTGRVPARGLRHAMAPGRRQHDILLQRAGRNLFARNPQPGVGNRTPIGHEPLSIVVEQRFYKSTAAIGLYLLLFAGVLIAAFKTLQAGHR
ncbi:MAG: hypothetical protein V8Q54_04595, partial [Alistipes senegalensis]